MNNVVRDHFLATGALLEGHFRLSSGLHSDRYLQCAKVLMHPERAEELCRLIRAAWTGPDFDLVCGPAIGGITFAYELGRAFRKPAIFAERSDGVFALRRGFEVPAGTRVLVAEDVVTTGGSVIEVIELLRSIGAVPVAVASLVHRGETNPFDVPFQTLWRQVFTTWTETECPLCRDGVPWVKPGSRPGGAA